ncbi:MAG: tRNA (adenosine(37)-N6)-dimethylallyltransferase MiaA [Actinomycetia bacterium]|nr:tRNA (adenosine(37)-N6)-dimethylallyltransferase MiaA [Actinomycetes bacterium]
MGDGEGAAVLPIIAVVGATATGKSALALDLAEALADHDVTSEVVGADAMQLYRGMDIGTAKLPEGERRGVPHHLIDVLDVTEEASVAAYQRHSRSAIAQIRARGHLPLLVGGSGLYVRAALDHLEIPPTDPAVRASYDELLTQIGVERLYGLLRERDPAAAAAIEPRNGRRIVRALEVIELTGRPFSASMPRREYVSPAVQVGVRRERAELDARVEARVRDMWAGGLIDEVRALVPQGLRDGFTASRAIGYEQALQQLDGALTQDEAISATQAATRRYVRRQESWFGADPRIEWFEAGSEQVARAVATTVLEQLAGAAEPRPGSPMTDNGGHG